MRRPARVLIRLNSRRGAARALKGRWLTGYGKIYSHVTYTADIAIYYNIL